MTGAAGWAARLLGGAVVLASALGWPLLAADPAGAATGERITSYDVVLTIGTDGGLAVRETIDYDFGNRQRHGIERSIPVRVPFDTGHDRTYEVRDFRVEQAPGAYTDHQRSDDGGVATFRLGDPDATVTGEQGYVLAYTVDGALNAFDDHDELYWNAVGDGWAVPIERVSVVVRAPAAITAQACFAGATGSTLPCTSLGLGQGADAGTMTAGQADGGLAPYQSFTVVVGLPTGAVASTGPVLVDRWSLRAALIPTPLTGALAGLVLLPGLAGVVWLLTRLGRDRRYAGLTPGLGASDGGPEESVPLAGAGPVAVAFAPPPGLRPGQVGTLLDERASVLDVTATIVDLAVRGHLRIVETERPHWYSSRDWRLQRLAGPEDLLPYERLLRDGLFQDADADGVVMLSELKKTFATRMAAVQKALYEDVTRAGWFRGRPDTVRSRWQAAGFVVAFAGGWLTVALVQRLHWAPVGLAVMLVGAALFVVGRRMPARTAAGSAVLAQARGFREYLRTAEADQLRFEEGQDVFSRYLPYAVVFGETERWVRVFVPLFAASAAGSAGTGWYVGPTGFDPARFGDSLGSFTSSAGSTLAAATPSSSGGSGFSGGGSSGGGGGGGGGGSW